MTKQTLLSFTTTARSITDITSDINQAIQLFTIDIGLCHVFCQHTSASLLLTENCDSKVKHDIEYFLSNLVKDGDENFQHNSEGDDDMSAHIRSILTQSEICIPIQHNQLALGRWQGIHLYEHRYNAHKRNILITCLG